MSKRTFVEIITGCLLIALVGAFLFLRPPLRAAGTSLVADTTANTTAQQSIDTAAISKAFRIYGINGQLIGYDKVTNACIVYWQDDRSVYETVYADGLLIGTVKLRDIAKP